MGGAAGVSAMDGDTSSEDSLMYEYSGGGGPPLIADFRAEQQQRRVRRQGPPFAGAGLDPTLQVQLEMVRTLQQMRRGHSGHAEHSDDGEDAGYMREVKASGISDLHRQRRLLTEQPLRAVMLYRQRVMRRLGVSLLEGGQPSAPWQHTDYSNRVKPHFGRMTGLWRVHYGLSKMLSLAEMKQRDLLAATIVQMLKSVHQVALDGGGWQNAVLLRPWQDPLSKELWAGEDQEMATAARYSRAIRDLQVKTAANEGLAEVDEGDAEPGSRRRYKGDPKAKPKPKPKTEG